VLIRGRSASDPGLRHAHQPSINEGHRLLREVTDSNRVLAAKVGCGSATVSRWRAGELRPAPAMRTALFEAYGIPLRSWDVVPGAQLEGVRAPARPPLPPADPNDASVSEKSTLADVLLLIASIREAAAQPDLVADERRKLMVDERQALALRHKLEQDAEELEERIVKGHPSWRRIQVTLVKALGPFPQAARAVAAALADLDAGAAG
jgi:transcriptional regulator with XRE-family HTH domain